MAGTTYSEFVKGKTAEEILANDAAPCDVGNESRISGYLQVAAVVRSNQDLIAELKKASKDSGRLTLCIVGLTAALVVVGLAQAAATWFHT